MTRMALRIRAQGPALSLLTLTSFLLAAALAAQPPEGGASSGERGGGGPGVPLPTVAKLAATFERHEGLLALLFDRQKGRVWLEVLLIFAEARPWPSPH